MWHVAHPPSLPISGSVLDGEELCMVTKDSSVCTTRLGSQLCRWCSWLSFSSLSYLKTWSISFVKIMSTKLFAVFH